MAGPRKKYELTDLNLFPAAYNIYKTGISYNCELQKLHIIDENDNRLTLCNQVEHLEIGELVDYEYLMEQGEIPLCAVCLKSLSAYRNALKKMRNNIILEHKDDELMSQIDYTPEKSYFTEYINEKENGK